jgi:transcription elongation factor SPT4
VFDCTSANYDGMMAVMDPSDSWVAKWQRIDHCVRGMYAISVSGELPENIRRMLRYTKIRKKIIQNVEILFFKVAFFF